MRQPRRKPLLTFFAAVAACGTLVSPIPSKAQPAPDAPPAKDQAVDEKRKPPVPVKFANDSLVLPVPGEWKHVRPRNRIIELEFSVPAEASDSEQEEQAPAAGRMTVMRSGGGVEANIARWIGQFRDIEPTDEGEKAKIDETEVADMPLHLVDISGTFLDSPRGPFGPKTELPNQRMLGGILQTPSDGTYFFKLVGPQPLVKDNAKAFREMLSGIKAPSE